MHPYPLFNGRRTQMASKEKMERRQQSYLWTAERRRGLGGALPVAIIGPDPGLAVESGFFFLNIFIIYPKEPSKIPS